MRMFSGIYARLYRDHINKYLASVFSDARDGSIGDVARQVNWITHITSGRELQHHCDQFWWVLRDVSYHVNDVCYTKSNTWYIFIIYQLIGVISLIGYAINPGDTILTLHCKHEITQYFESRWVWLMWVCSDVVIMSWSWHIIHGLDIVYPFGS